VSDCSLRYKLLHITHQMQVFHCCWRCVVLTRWWEELREVLWLASVVGGLSAVGVILAVAAAITGSVWSWRARWFFWQHSPWPCSLRRSSLGLFSCRI